jgi:hypothetical protein
MDQRSSSVLPYDGLTAPVPAWRNPENASALRTYLDATEAARVAIEARDRARDTLARVSSRPPPMRLGSERVSSRVSAYRIPLPEERSQHLPDTPSSWFEREPNFAAAETEPAEEARELQEMELGTPLPLEQQEATEKAECDGETVAPSRRQTLPGMPTPSLPPASERVRRAVLPPKASLPPQSTRYRVVAS